MRFALVVVLILNHTLELPLFYEENIRAIFSAPPDELSFAEVDRTDQGDHANDEARVVGIEKRALHDEVLVETD